MSRVAIATGLALFAGLLLGGQVALAYTAFFASFAIFAFTSRLSVARQILIATALGIAFGLVDGSGVERAQVVGRLFIAMLKMMIAPMILLAIINGISSMGTARDVGRIGARTIWRPSACSSRSTASSTPSAP